MRILQVNNSDEVESSQSICLTYLAFESASNLARSLYIAWLGALCPALQPIQSTFSFVAQVYTHSTYKD